MRLAIGSDHAGFALKEHLKTWLAARGHDVLDLGTDSESRCDYPDFGFLVAQAIVRGEAERGILICGTGLGMAITANRLTGVRAASCTMEYAAEMARRHNDANVLTMGARLVTRELAERLVDVFLSTPFEGGRHEERVRKMDRVPRGVSPAGRKDGTGGCLPVGPA